MSANRETYYQCNETGSTYLFNHKIVYVAYNHTDHFTDCTNGNNQTLVLSKGALCPFNGPLCDELRIIRCPHINKLGLEKHGC